jgi:hypothetical protein
MRKLALFAALTLATACGGGTPCDTLADAIEAKYDECGFTLPEADTATEDDACDLDEATADCQASCYKEATCGAVDGSDAAAVADWGSCMAACVATDTDTTAE